MRIRITNHCNKNYAIGLDAGFRSTGVCVIELGSTPSLAQTLRLSTERSSAGVAQGKTVSDDYLDRSVRMYRQISNLLEKFKPKFVAAELPVGGAKSAKAMAFMCMAISVVGCACAANGVELRTVRPSETKKLVRPKGEVDKREVQAYVEKVFGVTLPTTGDAAEHIADAMGAFLVAYRKQ